MDTGDKFLMQAAIVAASAQSSLRIPESSSIALTRLDTDNYSIWCVCTKCLLVSRGLWKPVVETGDDKKLDDKGLAIIGLTITEQHLSLPRLPGTSLLLSSRARARRGVSTSREAEEPLSIYFSRAKRLRAQLASIGDPIKENELVMSVLEGLPSDTDIVATVLTTTESELTLDNFLSKLLMVESRSGASLQGIAELLRHGLALRQRSRRPGRP